MSNTELQAKLAEARATVIEIEKQIKNDAVKAQDEAVADFKKIYVELNITPQQLAKGLGFNLGDAVSTVKPPKTSNPKKCPIFYFEDENGKAFKNLVATTKSLSKSPWKAFVLDGTINSHTVRYYKGTEYWTDAKSENKPDDAIKSGLNGCSNVELTKKKIEAMA
jgi:hypothetical protein